MGVGCGLVWSGGVGRGVWGREGERGGRGALVWVRDKGEHYQYLPRPLLLAGINVLTIELLGYLYPCSNSFVRFGCDYVFLPSSLALLPC
jgi:hypothetical protein